jgi:hypothetical protein
MRQQARLLRSAAIRAMIRIEPRQSLAGSPKKALVALLARLAHHRSAGPRSRQRESRRGRSRSSKLQENGALLRIFWQNRMRAGLQLPCQIKYLRVLHGRLFTVCGATTKRRHQRRGACRKVLPFTALRPESQEVSHIYNRLTHKGQTGSADPDNRIGPCNIQVLLPERAKE